MTVESSDLQTKRQPCTGAEPLTCCQPPTGRDPDVDRLVPVRAERYKGLLLIFTEAIREHSRPLVAGGHGKPPVDCGLCSALRYLIAPGAPEVGADERRYLDETYPPAAGVRRPEAAGGES